MEQPTVRTRALTAGALALGLCGFAWSASPSDARGTALAAADVAARAPAMNIVVLGDSIATTNACSGCTGYPELYGRAVARRTGADVDVDNLAVPGTGVTDLLGQVRNDQVTREALAGADVVVLEIGFNDTPWNRGDDPCHVAPDYPVVLWDQITDECIASVTEDYAIALDAVLDTVDELTSDDAALRVVGVYNSTIGDHVDPSWDSPEAVEPSIKGNAAFVAVQRGTTDAHGGVFVNMLKRMNGPLGRHEAAKYLADDYTHLNQRGHQLTARALAQSGWADGA
jgi:lysophospholipase L1-like esterase